MSMKENKTKNVSQTVDNHAANIFPGVSVDIADDEKVSNKLVKERTKTLNNNPRNNDWLDKSRTF